MPYLSKPMVLEAYKKLSEIHEDPTMQGATQVVSALRYFFALDMFYKTEGRNCNVRDKEDKFDFSHCVGKFCRVCDSEMLYTPQFYLPLKQHNGDYNCGSNFYSVGQVKVSRNNGGQLVEYPQRGQYPLFNIQSEMLIRNVGMYKNLLHYIPHAESRMALALWLNRANNLAIVDNDFSVDALYNGLKEALLNDYTQELVDALLPKEIEAKEALSQYSISYLSGQPCQLVKADFYTLFPMSAEAKESDNMSVGTLAMDKVRGTEFENLLTAMRTKPFLLLAGISGTGKSRIVKEMAFVSCPQELQDEDEVSPGNYCIIEVKPNWHDSTEILGYYSTLSSKYMVTPFLNFLIKAWMNPNVPFFVCLDEMNLAPVEHYFAEFLSVLESRKLKNGVIVSEPIVKPEVIQANLNSFKCAYYNLNFNEHHNKYIEAPEADMEVWAKLSQSGLTLPPNLIVVGTVNMDDTTCQFSRKVIDRAMTVEMNEVDFDAMLDPEREDTLKYRDEPIEAKYFLPKYASARDAHSQLNDEDKQLMQVDAVAMLKSLDQHLKGSPFRIAYRVQNELVIYFAALREENPEVDGNALLNQAFDDIMLMKVLPRIEGGEELNDTLRNLESFTRGNYPRSNAKIQEMQHYLAQKNFTSFWP
ncbi:MAG: hypothetical protein LIP03_01950 [Bacteroidales bacterium]|nr:hypothetical protein [Bacteroidales bacterium]